MDITIRIDLGQGNYKSHTFIGDKEEILLPIQKYIEEHKYRHIDVLFQNEEDAQNLTYDELFNP